MEPTFKTQKASRCCILRRSGPSGWGGIQTWPKSASEPCCPGNSPPPPSAVLTVHTRCHRAWPRPVGLTSAPAWTLCAFTRLHSLIPMLWSCAPAPLNHRGAWKVPPTHLSLVESRLRERVSDSSLFPNSLRSKVQPSLHISRSAACA